MRKGDNIVVKCKKDGRYYDCRAVNLKSNRVKIHYVGWNKARDEWIDLDDPRIVSGASGTSRASSLLHRSPPTMNRTSTEKTIDELYSTMCSQPVGSIRGANHYSPPIQSNKRKCSAEPDIGQNSGNARKRSLITPMIN